MTAGTRNSSLENLNQMQFRELAARAEDLEYISNSDRRRMTHAGREKNARLDEPSMQSETMITAEDLL